MMECTGKITCSNPAAGDLQLPRRRGKRPAVAGAYGVVGEGAGGDRGGGMDVGLGENARDMGTKERKDHGKKSADP